VETHKKNFWIVSSDTDEHFLNLSEKELSTAVQQATQGNMQTS